MVKDPGWLTYLV